PALGNLPDITIDEQAAYSPIVQATDPDLPAQALQFFLDEGPSGLTLDANTGRLQWTPTEAQGPGVYPVTVRVVDGASPALSASKRFFITVRDSNAAPSLAPIADQIVIEGDTLTVTAVGSDSDIPAQTLAFTMQGPAGAQINPTSGVFTWTPSAAQIPSTNTVTITVTDSGSPAQSASRQFVVVTAKQNHAPTFTAVADQSIAEEVDFSLQLQASDIDVGQTLSFAIEGAAPAGLTVSNTGLVQWRPTEDQGPTTNQITVRVTDDGSPARSVTGTLKIVVTEVNRAPVITAIGNQTARVGEVYTLDVVATDADRPINSMTFSIDAPIPAGMTINPTSGRISWTPGAALANSDVAVTVRATDNGSPVSSGTRSFSIHVEPAITWRFVSMTGTASSSRIYVYLEAPGDVIMDDLQLVAGAVPATGPNLLNNGNFETALAGSWNISANHADSTLTNVAKSGVSALHAVATVGGTTQGSSIWQDITPALTAGAEYTISYWYVPNTNNINLNVRLSGNGIIARTNIFEQPNRAPTLGNLPDVQIPEGAPYSLIATATDPDVPAQQLQFFMDEGPTGATFTGATGRFDWTPTEAQGPGVYPVTIRVVDNALPALSASKRFFITVNEVNSAPTLAVISDQVVIEGTTLIIDPVASDSDLPAQALTFSASGLANAQINPTTGRFTWTPTAAQVPSTNTVTIQVADSAAPALVASRTFKVVTDVGNHPPTFASLPTQSVQENTDFSLQLVAQDPDAGQALTFALEPGAPAGVTLTSGGLLQWHPTTAQGPSTNQISFRITDNGSPVRSITAFVTIIVTDSTPPPTIDLDATLTVAGEIQLQWDSAAGVVYRVYVRDDIEAGVWQSVTEITATGATTTYRAPANGSATRFLKVMALP
ncbi:MAG TPA: putative Ig domain-containing protein, partial [Verrucomicrobiae bacterium]|nr:putative Ig domain-containing protein [Verrucomicrobiae bacterium]